MRGLLNKKSTRSIGGATMEYNKGLSPEDKIIGTDQTVADFWKWGFSNLLTNSLRGIYAEFLVGVAIEALNGSRVEWDAFDIDYNGIKIEVKSSAYIQAWYNGNHSKISFGIAEKKEYDYATNKYSAIAQRHAQVYVFCLLKEKDRDRINPLDTRQWEFYVVATKDLNHFYPQQKSIVLSSLQKIAKPIRYDELKFEMDRVIDNL